MIVKYLRHFNLTTPCVNYENFITDDSTTGEGSVHTGSAQDTEN